MTETKRLVLVAKVTDKIGSEGKDVKSTFSTQQFSAVTVSLKSGRLRFYENFKKNPEIWTL